MFKLIENEKTVKRPGASSPDSRPNDHQTITPPAPDTDPEGRKRRIHRQLLDRLDLAQVFAQDGEETRAAVREVVEALCDEEEILLDASARKRIIAEVLDEVFGLGPLEELLADDSISDILVNGPKQVYVERNGRLEKTNIQFKDDAHVRHILDRIVSPIGRRCDEASPLVDARLPDGSRVNAIIPPLALDGPTISIRRFGTDSITWENYVGFDTCTPEMVELIRMAVLGRLNILIIGGTGSGKTTLLNNCSSFIPKSSRIVTIEDAAELQLRQPHVVRLETRPANIEGKGRITIGDLLINSLRMRPDRIVVGECRGGETLDMLQAMNTGHDGSLTTIHANSPRDSIQRVETMVMMSGFDLPARSIRMQFASAIDLIIHISRLTGGPRKILSITEVDGMEGDIVTMQEIIKFEQEGVGTDGRAYGRFVATGVRPAFLERIAAHGVDVSKLNFESRTLGSEGERNE